MTEREYRAINRLSYSSLKDFIEDRWKYYEKHELRIRKVEEQTYDMTFGTLVETKLWTPDVYHELFKEATNNKPKGQMGEVIEKLYNYTIAALSPEGVVTRDFTELLADAFNAVAFNSKGIREKLKKTSYETVLMEFEGSEQERYYKEMLANSDKYLVGPTDLKYADNCIAQLQKHWKTSNIVCRKSNERYNIHYQLVVLYEYLGIKMKSKLDMVSVDHDLKIIEIFDLKVTFDVELFNFSYRKFRYYIQAFLYYMAIRQWAKENGYGNYRIIPMRFIVAHSKAQIAPLIFRIGKGNMINARDGFADGNKWYMGVNEAISALKWHRDSEIWDISMRNFENKGDCTIKIYADDSGEINKHNVVSGAGVEY
ncbi:PDDEXK-like protein of unknown function [Chitinophaga sp. YR573]|uniref:PD-(D/E)XK nuclease-like domain-containing protein n=1 Tax=Chitinophaga sp. YR573 TaxID=1881040 RepID=UPI0008BB5980|nr:PD-(D/E)XK nuclease-like domain-containing protein [Chitinophaga sp. YR573]SEW21749.1 PDDEXK-like protein of unknown function [Chitinophaga sp. YR573]